jgi:putative phage-type endonuclease
MDNKSNNVPSFIQKRLSKNKYVQEEEITNDIFPRNPPPSLEDEKQMKILLKIPKMEQRTKEWYEARKTMITASDWAKALKKSKFGTKRDLILKKCDKIEFTENEATMWGTKHEECATRTYELRNGTIIHEFGVLRHPKYNFLGASPDGITPLGIMLEIKCPWRRTITGKVPDYYWIQIQGQLEVCNLEYCDFMECKITEYDGINEYINDVCKNPPKYPTKNLTDELREKYKNKDVFQFNKDGLEKGIIITFVNKNGERKYKYSEIGISKREFERWYIKVKDEVPKSWSEHGISFWRMDKISCVRVKRDKEWFKNSLPILKQAWEEIKHYRKVGTESIQRKKKDIGEIIEEPKSADTNAIIHQNMFDNLDDVTSMFLDDLPINSEKDLSKENKIISITDNIKPSGKIKPLLATSIADLELSSWVLPRYVPISPKIVNPYSQEELLIKLAGMNSIIKKCKMALINLNSIDKYNIISCEYNVINIVHNVDLWINGLPELLSDFLINYEKNLGNEYVEIVNITSLECVSWRNDLYPKWCDKMDICGDNFLKAPPSSPINKEDNIKVVNKEDNIKVVNNDSDTESITDLSEEFKKNSSDESDTDSSDESDTESSSDEKINEPPKTKSLEDFKKLPISVLAGDKYKEIMEDDLTDEERNKKLEHLENMRDMYAQLEMFKYND